MAAVQIAAVAARRHRRRHCHRYFPSKTDLIAELVAAVAGRELDAMKAAGDAGARPDVGADGVDLDFASRSLTERRLAWAVMGEPVDAAVDAMRLDFRQSLAAELESRINTVIERPAPPRPGRAGGGAGAGWCVDGRAAWTIGADLRGRGAGARSGQTATLLALRALGVVDARARGLVAQCVLP